MMLMTNNRQLVLVDTNSTQNATNMDVHKLHHPIIILSGNEGQVDQYLACRNGLKFKVNIFIFPTWILPFSTNPIDIER